jgi:hypothetical protein
MRGVGCESAGLLNGWEPPCSPAHDSSPTLLRKPSTWSQAWRLAGDRPFQMWSVRSPRTSAPGCLISWGALPGDSLYVLYPDLGIVSWGWQRWAGALAEEEVVPVLAPGAGPGVQEAS